MYFAVCVSSLRMTHATVAKLSRLVAFIRFRTHLALPNADCNSAAGLVQMHLRARHALDESIRFHFLHVAN